MQNLKIKVNNEAESKEVQELFFGLGYKWFSPVSGKYLECLEIYADTEGDLTTDATIRLGWESVYKETTLAELRDMVVLKRNDIEDATYACESIHHRRGYLSSDGVEYTWSYGQDKWIKSKKSFNENGLKPIEKTMQEYLNTETYEYKLAHKKPDEEWVSIPEGAIEARLTPSGSINFINSDSDYMNRVTGGEWVSTHRFKHDDAGHKIIWQRPTQPEALPFIDDNPQSLNEQYAEIEQVRQAVKVKSGGDSDHMADATSYGIMGIDVGQKHKHYFKDVSNLNEIDVYMVLKLFNVTDPCLQHIVKKALCAGQRGHKDLERDLKDILDTAKRAVDINKTC